MTIMPGADWPSRRRALFAFSAVAATAAGGPLVSALRAAAPPALDVPYVPTPDAVVARMLDMAAIAPRDHLIDLGCGDGRIPIAAARRFAITVYGVDIDPRRIEEARANARTAGVERLVRFEVRNLFETPIADATVLTLYLLAHVNLQLRPRILAELRPGTRVVSHQFDMGDWAPERSESVSHRTIHMWTVPERS